MPVNRSALIRYRVINRYLLNHKKATKEELKNACEEAFYGKEISYRTIDADLNAMRYDEGLQYYAPIRYDKWDRGYYYEEPGYTIEKIPLNTEEYETLLIAAKLLEQFSEAPVFQTFAVDRFKDYKVRKDIEFIDKRFSSGEYFRDSLGITVSREEPAEVHLAFTNLQAKYVMAHPLHSSQELVSDNGREVIIKYFLRSDYEFTSQILGWGDQVKVLKPESLASKIRSQLESALKNYS